MIVVVGGVKGGVGKTTVAINLAVMRQAAGRKVVIVDADEQRSAYEFCEQRKALGNGDLPCVVASGRDTLGVVRSFANEHDDIIIDVGGRDTTAQRAALLTADLAVIPFGVGNFDAWTLPQVERLVSEVRAANQSLDAVTFLSRGVHNGNDNREAADILRASTVLRYLDTPIIERRIYVRSAGDGMSVIEASGVRDYKARGELRSLYNAIYATAATATTAA